MNRDGEAVTEESLQDLVDQLDDVTVRRLLVDAVMRDEEMNVTRFLGHLIARETV